MDFSFTSDQQDLRELAAKILSDATTLERTKQVVADERRLRPRPVGRARRRRHRRHLAARVGRWRRASASSRRASCSKRSAAPPPRSRRSRSWPWPGPRSPSSVATDALDGVAAGTRIVTAALTEAVGDAYAPSTTATGGKLTGEKVCVPAGLDAQAIVVSAIDGLYLVDPSAAGVTVEREDTMLGVPTARLVLSNAGRPSSPVPRALTWLLERAQTAMTVDDVGRRRAALDLTADYVKEREQFGRADRHVPGGEPARGRHLHRQGSHQAHRVAGGVAARRRAARGRAGGDAAKYWAAQGGQDVLLAAHHLHGGVGVDRDYPLYRYFLLAKQLELDLGSETPTLVHLGALIADTPVG